MEQLIVGIDVSKAWLDAYARGTGQRFRVANDKSGIAELLERLGGGSGIRVVMEASGGYERMAHEELVERGVWAAIVNPKRVRDVARGIGVDAKTDRVDAAVIARYGAIADPSATAVLPAECRELAEFLACRKQLVDELTARKQQLEHLASQSARQMVTEMIAYLTRKRDDLDRAIDAHLAAHEVLRDTFGLLTTMRGCGRILALTLVTELPELGSLDRREIAAPCGAVGTPQPH